MKRENWIWMPHPGHFICARDCKFHLNTYVGSYIVSTVGEMLPDAPVREIFAQTRGVTLVGMGDERLADYMKKIGYEDLGLDRKYETMVFKAVRATERSCCPWRQESGSGVDSNGYNDPFEAFKGHVKLCLKWSRRK